MDGGLFFYDTPLSGLAARFRVRLHEVNVLNNNPILAPKDFQDLAHLTLFLARNDFNFVILLDAALCSRHNSPLPESG
jgi:hypothetical protein